MSRLVSVTYKSKKDTWLIMVIYGGVWASLAECVTLAISGCPWIFVTTLFALGVVLPVWILQTTFYVLDDEQLCVRSGPFGRSIPLTKIQSVKRTCSMLSSPALSLDRVQIRYDHLGIFSLVLISPENRDQFLADLENRRNCLGRRAQRA